MMKTYAKHPRTSEGAVGVCRKLRSRIAEQVLTLGIMYDALSNGIQAELTGTAKLMLCTHAQTLTL
jgi:hypothetical protein